MNIKRLLFVSKDPGGVNSIIPIIKKCIEASDKYECIIIAHELTQYRYIEEDISFISLNKFNYKANKKKAVLKILTSYHPDIVITGSSRPYDIESVTPEQIFVEIAKEKKILSISILDYWGEYLERFSSFDGEFNLEYVPDKLCALDQISFKSLLDLGITKDNIEITHNPNFDRIVQKTFKINPQLLNDKIKYNVLFISQPLIETKDKYNQGYSQIDIFNNLLIFLNNWKSCTPKNVQVWLHPKEDKNKWDKMISEGSSKFIKIEISEKRDNNTFEWADFLVSGFSTLMYQALYYLLPVISMQIGLNKKDQLITNDLALSIPLYTMEEMLGFSKDFNVSSHSQMLEERKNKLSRKNIFFSDGRATQRIINIIDNMIIGEYHD